MSKLDTSGALRRHYTSERLEIEYSPAKWHPDREATLRDHHRRGEEAVRALHPQRDIGYGPGRLQTLDVFVASEDAPLCVILHGGFWRTSDKAAMHFLAGHLCRQGLTCVVPNFDLCPDVSVAQIVQQVGAALDFVAARGAPFFSGAGGMYLIGHATGAHIAAMMLVEAGPAPRAAWRSSLRGSLLMSGLYDLRRIPDLAVNDVLGMDAAMATALSPALSRFVVNSPVIIAAAAGETPEFCAQSDDMAAMVRRSGVPVESFLVEDAGHFTILDKILHREEPCMAAFLRLMTARTTDKQG